MHVKNSHGSFLLVKVVFSLLSESEEVDQISRQTQKIEIDCWRQWVLLLGGERTFCTRGNYIFEKADNLHESKLDSFPLPSAMIPEENGNDFWMVGCVCSADIVLHPW